MKIPKTFYAVIFAVVIFSCVAIPLTAGVFDRAYNQVEVFFKDNDEPVSGILRRVSTSVFLLQSGDRYLVFDGDDLESVNGHRGIPRDIEEGRLIFSSFYEKIQARGDVEVWYRNKVANNGYKAILSTTWGVKEHELSLYREMTVFDNFGNQLELKLIPKGNGDYLAEVHFIVPVVPGEELEFSVRIIRHGVVKEKDGIFTYSYNVDFTEDRVISRKIEIPDGYEVVETYSGCSRLDIDGRTLLFSKRYYPTGTEDRLEIRYKLK